jgi:L-asparaginase / beta-aspartyl-peptidase
MNSIPFSIAIHGGAGTISPSSMTPEKEAAYRMALNDAVTAGHLILKQGGSALDAVEKAIVSLEDSPLFNAGRGSVFTHEGTIEMDASVMDGKSANAGAVAGISGVKNPIALARRVMEASGHVMLMGKGAEEFARSQQLAFMPDDYFFTDFRWQQLEQARKEGKVILDHTEEKKFGTVGAVALDKHGNLAAGTSTGGMTNKRFGRVGDTPLIGGGTFAHNGSCAVSCTGSGEYFIRGVIAHSVSAQMQFGKMSLSQACESTIHGILTSLGGDGGLIAVNAQGEIEMCFNTDGMYRAMQLGDDPVQTFIYK